MNQKRCLSIHEYMSMGLLKAYDVPILRGEVATDPEKAYSLAMKDFSDKKGNVKVVIKAQVLAGGRGKGIFKNGFQGGVHRANSYVVVVVVMHGWTILCCVMFLEPRK